MRHTYKAEQWLPYPVPKVFAFFANPANLPRLMPPWQRARIEQATFAPPPSYPPDADPQLHPQTAAAGAGTRMTLSFRPVPLSPIRVSWDAEISEFAWNDHFCDVQLRGPFAFWNHCHRVEAHTRKDAGEALIAGTLLRDVVEYQLPLGPLGDLAQRLFIKRQLRSTFQYRQQRTTELLALESALQPT